jgi:hypothetical protein
MGDINKHGENILMEARLMVIKNYFCQVNKKLLQNAPFAMSVCWFVREPFSRFSYGFCDCTVVQFWLTSVDNNGH